MLVTVPPMYFLLQDTEMLETIDGYCMHLARTCIPNSMRFVVRTMLNHFQVP